MEVEDPNEEIVGKSGMTKEQLLKSMMEDFYKATPELEKEMPKKHSKIMESLHKKEVRQEPVADRTVYSGKYISFKN